METAFGEELIRYSKAVNSDEVVAYGAAVQGAAMMESFFKTAPPAAVEAAKAVPEPVVQNPPSPTSGKSKKDKKGSQKDIDAAAAAESKKAAKKADEVPQFITDKINSLQISTTTDVDGVSLDLGVKASDGRMMPVLTRGTAVPALNTVTCSVAASKGGNFYHVQIFEGQRLMADDNRNVGCFTLPCQKGAKSQIEVTLCLDEANVLHAKAEGQDFGGATFNFAAVEGQEVDTEETVQEVIDLAEEMQDQDEEVADILELKHNLLQRAKKLVVGTEVDAVRAKAVEVATWAQACFDGTAEFSEDEANSLNAMLDAVEGISSGASSKTKKSAAAAAALADVDVDMD